MADNMNHSDVNVICEIITKSFHLEADEESQYFTKTKYMNNYSVIFDKSEIKHDNDYFNIFGRFSKENFKENQKLYSIDEFAMHSTTKQIWELPWIKDAFHEDNDTDEDEDYDSEYDDEEDEEANLGMMNMLQSMMSVNGSKKVLKEIKRGGGLKFFINKEKVMLYEKAKVENEV